MEFSPATDKEVIEAFQLVARKEGILAAMESSHALAWVVKNAGSLSPEQVVVVNVSGRGDKDIFIVAEAVGDESWMEYCREYGAGRIQ